MKAIYIAAALLFSVFGTAASAAPAAPLQALAVESPLVLAQAQHQSRRHGAPRHVQPRHRGPRHHYTPGYRYNSAPHGWHRHHSRPGNWRNRGCIMVGPMWFCP